MHGRLVLTPKTHFPVHLCHSTAALMFTWHVRIITANRIKPLEARSTNGIATKIYFWVKSYTYILKL